MSTMTSSTRSQTVFTVSGLNHHVSEHGWTDPAGLQPPSAFAFERRLTVRLTLLVTRFLRLREVGALGTTAG